MKKNNFKISIVVSDFYPELSDLLFENCFNQLIKNGINKDFISTYKVSGAFEIPGVVSQIAKHALPDAIITLGVVIKGETPHFDFISAACANSISLLTIQNEFPITFGVLTTNTYKQALKRAQEKGAEIADTTLSSINTYQSVKLKKP